MMWSLPFLSSLRHDLLHLSECMSKVSIFGNDLHVWQTHIIHPKELKSQSRENQCIIVRIWSRLTIFQEEVVDHLLNVVLISVIRAATLQTYILKCSSTKFDVWIIILKCFRCYLQCHLHHVNRNSMIVTMMFLWI